MGADHIVEYLGESSDAFLGVWKANLDALILTQPFKKLDHVQIWQQRESLH